MGKGGRGGSRGSSLSTGMLAGLHLVGGSVGVNACDSEDTGFYCQLSRFFSSVSMIVSLVMMIVIIYYLAKLFIFKRK